MLRQRIEVTNAHSRPSILKVAAVDVLSVKVQALNKSGGMMVVMAPPSDTDVLTVVESGPMSSKSNLKRIF